MNVAKTAFIASLALLAGLVGLLYWQTSGDRNQVGAPIVILSAESFRVPLDAVKLEFEKETNQPVEVRYGTSQDILTQLSITTKQGDLFLPADDSYIELARKKDLVAELLPLASMRAVIVARPGFERPIKSWDDVLAPGVKLGLANPDAAAIGKLLRDHLRQQGRWDAVERANPAMLGTVNQVGNAAQIGSIDVGVMWDAVAASFPRISRMAVPELKDVKAQVQIAVAKNSTQPTQALRLARYIAAKDRGLLHLKKQGFEVTPNADAWDERPHLIVFAGSMLRPAIEKTLDEFQKREGVPITTTYNGCGILVGQMKTGAKPDLYFACDPQFLHMVRDRFDEPTVISKNQLVIAVPKGNEHNLKTLKDLGKPGLRVGVGHEQQCALGAITRETFLQSGTYAAVRKNVAVQAPSGDLLVVQLRGGSLDAVVAYQSNVTPYAKDIDAVPVTGIPCAAPEQPIAIRRNCRYPQLARRLWLALQTEESRQRFEELGFGWEVK
ncbi:MAG: extracellular solute-binding protein [Gemmataceae bacterium]|nr:extracellular solute-binding protein [Gemmataceae bacterium]